MCLFLSHCCSYLIVLHRANFLLCVDCCHGDKLLWDYGMGRVLQPVRVSLGFHEPMSPSQVGLNKTFLNWWELQIGEVIDTVDFLAFIFRSALLGWLRRDDAGEMRSELAILVPILIKGIICFSKS